MSNVYTVSQVNTYIKNMFAHDFALSKIYVKGEVSNCKYHTSGHIYFTLKDKGGVIPCVMFAGNRKGLSFQLQEGQNVIALGSITIYERDGRYQLYAREIILEGAGDLYKKFEELKEELASMGMFDDMYKKSIPKYALKVGICTAHTGAAIRDIINIASRRNPYVQLYLYPSLVQGEMAPASIVNGINCLDTMGLDVIIVGRGGGSIEDLWAFNEEIVARAIFNCNTPIISAVGHETDTTISDYVADLRAPTPSAAAELAVFEYNEFVNRLDSINNILKRRMLTRVEYKSLELKRLEDRLKFLSPFNQIMQRRQYLMDLSDKIEKLMNNRVVEYRYRLSVLVERLNGNSPLRKISGGYAYVTDENSKQIKSVGDISEKSVLMLTFKDGKVKTTVEEIVEKDILGEE